MGIGVGVGGIQPVIAQLGRQGAFGNPYVSPALGGGDSMGMHGGAGIKGDARSAYEPIQQNPIATPPQQLGAVNGTYRPAGSGSQAGLSSLVSGSSSSLNSMPSMGGASGSGGSGGPFPLEGKYGIIKMANGGLASAAQNISNQGRKGDTELVHMTKGEIKGLQDLALAHGGSLSINPNTGLVEASFLKNLLPMIAGIGLNMMFPGSGALIGLGVGGFEAARTGDIGKGLMAGLGAYGGANIGSALASAAPGATTSLAPATTSVAGESARNVGADILRSNAGAGIQGSMSALPEAGSSVLSNFQTTASPTLANMGAGAKEIFTNPDAATAFIKQNPTAIGSVAAPILSSAMAPKPVDPITPEKSSGKYISDNFQAYVPNQPNPYYRPQGLGYTGYADGGMIDSMQQMPNGGLAAIQGQRDGYGAPATQYGEIPQMADGGSIGGYSDGGRMLKGPGDGMSDSIPGVIGNKQPARLADGEFVMPADVVSHLGNGSTDAGAKRLYSMMDKVRKARTGTKKQGKQIKPEKYMLA